MEAYITLTEVHGNRWELTVRLPIKWLREFSQLRGQMVFGKPLHDLWGELLQENGISQPWRYMQQVYCSLDKAEQSAKAITDELAAARDSLQPKGFIKYTLDLSSGGAMNVQADRNVPNEEVKF